MTDSRTLSTERLIAFSTQQVFSAFASGKLLASWWGPNGFTNTFDVFEFRPGGRWIFTMHSPDGGNFENESYFESIVPDEKIVIRHDCAPLFTLTISLNPENEGTRLVWEQVFDDVKTAQVIKQRAGKGNEENLDRLEQALKQASP